MRGKIEIEKKFYFKGKICGFELSNNRSRGYGLSTQGGHFILNRGFRGFKLRISPFNRQDVPWRLRIFILNRGFGDLN